MSSDKIKRERCQTGLPSVKVSSRAWAPSKISGAAVGSEHALLRTQRKQAHGGASKPCTRMGQAVHVVPIRALVSSRRIISDILTWRFPQFLE